MKKNFLLFWAVSCLCVAQLSSAMGRMEGPLVVRERLAHQSAVEYVSVERETNGTLVTNLHRYIHIASGLNRYDEVSETWQAASPAFELKDGGAIAANTQHKLLLPGNINQAGHGVQVTSHLGEELRLQCLGIALTDPVSGRSVFLAETKDRQGVLISSNVVVYEDAFEGFKADIKVENRLNGVENDVVLRERISRAVLDVGGFDPETTRIEVWHQALGNPQVSKSGALIKRKDGRVEEDQTIRIRGYEIAQGSAFALAAPNAREQRTEVPVAKQWVRMEGMDFLVEGVPFTAVEAYLERLPAMEASRVNRLKAAQQMVANSHSRIRPLSLAMTAGNAVEQRLLAVTSGQKPSGHEEPGFVLDWIYLNTTLSNMTFAGNTTYYMDAPVDLYGTTVIEGGTVVKSLLYYLSPNPVLNVRGPLVCKTGPFDMAFFTCIDDDTVGDRISGSLGVPEQFDWRYAAYNIRFIDSTNHAIDLHDIKSSFAKCGIGFSRSSSSNRVSNVQILSCVTGIETAGGNVAVQNALLHDVRYAFGSTTTSGKNIVAEHVTVNSAEQLFYYPGGVTNSLFLTNSLTSTITNDTTAGIYSNYVANVSPSDFQTKVDGHHYLPVDSPYRDAGTTNITPEAASIIRTTTTYAPTKVTQWDYCPPILRPTVGCDTDIPDLGYHYYPLDFIAHNLLPTIKLRDGVRIASHLRYSLFAVGPGQVLEIQGSPLARNRIMRHASVQERPTTNTVPQVAVNTSYGTPAEIRVSYTDISTHAATAFGRSFFNASLAYHGGQHYLFEHSTLKNDYIYHNVAETPPEQLLTYRNCILERCDVSVQSAYYYYAPRIDWRNTVLHKGTFVIGVSGEPPGTIDWKIRDCFLNVDTLTIGFYPHYYSYQSYITNGFSHNAYRTGLPTLGGTNNITGVVADFEAGPFGNYYYPNSGTNLYRLVDAGSRTASAASLYHFSTQVDQTVEGSSTVDIGFHYPAVDNQTNRLIDTDGDGAPNIVEDPNGNGTAEFGETDWSGSGDYRLGVTISRPRPAATATAPHP